MRAHEKSREKKKRMGSHKKKINNEQWFLLKFLGVCFGLLHHLFTNFQAWLSDSSSSERAFLKNLSLALNIFVQLIKLPNYALQSISLHWKNNRNCSCSTPQLCHFQSLEKVLTEATVESNISFAPYNEKKTYQHLPGWCKWKANPLVLREHVIS